MKTFRTALLAAAAIGAGLPALVQAQDAPQDQNERFRERGGNRGDRGERPDGGQRPDRGAQPQAAPPPQATPQPQPAIRSQDVQRRQWGPDRSDSQNRRYAPGQQPNANFDRRNFGDRGDRGDRNAPPPPPAPGRPDRPNGFAQGRPGYDRAGGNWQRPGDYGRPGGGDWRGRDWRQDRRYDWRGFRNQNRSLFRAPRYYAPRGWSYGYRRFDIGFRLPPFLFGSEYWIADPWAYRLPPVDGPYRWVRYYNDVLLIDLRSGAVVDEIPDFFF